jgi:hypothetical protein
MIQIVGSTLCLSCHSSAPRTFPTRPYRMEQTNQSDGRRSLPSSLSIPPYTLHRKLLTMVEEEEAVTPPTITTTVVVDRRRQHSEAAAACSAIMMMMLLQQESQQKEEAVEPKGKKTRTARRLFDCEGAYNCIMRDHLGRNPLYGKEFPLFFRLSRTRVQLILEDLVGRLSETSHPFFQSFRVDKFGRVGASVEATKVLLPLKSLAYGVAPHCFADYFQVSKPMARERVCQTVHQSDPIPLFTGVPSTAHTS